MIGDVVGGLSGLVGGSWLLGLGFAVLAVAALGPRDDDLAARPGRRCL